MRCRTLSQTRRREGPRRPCPRRAFSAQETGIAAGSRAHGCGAPPRGHGACRAGHPGHGVLSWPGISVPDPAGPRYHLPRCAHDELRWAPHPASLIALEGRRPGRGPGPPKEPEPGPRPTFRAFHRPSPAPSLSSSERPGNVRRKRGIEETGMDVRGWMSGRAIVPIPGRSGCGGPGAAPTPGRRRGRGSRHEGSRGGHRSWRRRHVGPRVGTWRRWGRSMLTLSVVPGELGICRLDRSAEVPPWAVEGGFCSVTRTPDELSVVCPGVSIPAGVRAERGWRALKVEGPLEFGQTGVLSSLAGPWRGRASASLRCPRTTRTTCW